MGRTGSALDNAVAESFHSTLEFELRSRQRWTTRDQARRAVVAWLAEYNTDRLHPTNGMISPVDDENGRRRPDAKTYHRLRRRNPPAAETTRVKNPSEAAAPPDIPVWTLRDGHRRRAASGPAPPASRAATAVATATPRPPAATAPAGQAALDLGAATGPGRQHQGQARACPRARATQPDQDP
jgi:transposase InsO family protein